ncbi:hypothetical protein HDU67_003964, partial [Dinochytrium kinnereticum]
PVEMKEGMYWAFLVFQVLGDRLLSRIADYISKLRENSALAKRGSIIAPVNNIDLSDEPRVAREETNVKSQIIIDLSTDTDKPTTVERHQSNLTLSARTTLTSKHLERTHTAARAIGSNALSVITKAANPFSDKYSLARNDQAYSNYLSTLSGLICILLPNSGEGWMDVVVANGNEFAFCGVSGWRLPLILYVFILPIEVGLETLFVYIEARRGVPIGSVRKLKANEA